MWPEEILQCHVILMEPGPRVDMHDENKSVQEHHTIVNVMIVGPETKMCVYRYDYSQ